MTDSQLVETMVTEVRSRYRVAKQTRGKADFSGILFEVIKSHGVEPGRVSIMRSMVSQRFAASRKGRKGGR
jgi:hypothetical protein